MSPNIPTNTGIIISRHRKYFSNTFDYKTLVFNLDDFLKLKKKEKKKKKKDCSELLRTYVKICGPFHHNPF